MRWWCTVTRGGYHYNCRAEGGVYGGRARAHHADDVRAGAIIGHLRHKPVHVICVVLGEELGCCLCIVWQQVDEA